MRASQTSNAERGELGKRRARSKFAERTRRATDVSAAVKIEYYASVVTEMAGSQPFAVIGFSDDVAVLSAAFAMVSRHLQPRHYEAADRALADKPEGMKTI